MAAIVRPYKLDAKSRNLAVTHKQQVDYYFDWAFEGQARVKYFATRTSANLQVENTLNVEPTIWVEELIYPGLHSLPVIDKWIYVGLVSGDSMTIIKECYARFSGVGADALYKIFHRDNPPEPTAAWDATPPDNDTPGFQQLFMAFDSDRREIGIPLPIKQATKPSDVRVFISPWRFHKTCYTRLADTNFKDTAFIAARGGTRSGLFAVAMDPLAWTLETKLQFYEPASEAYHQFLADEEKQCKNAIASTLKAWIETDNDALGIDNELRSGEPDTFLAQYKREEMVPRIPMEQAAAYLKDGCVYSTQYMLAETAAMDGGAHGGECISMNYAMTTVGLSECRTGRDLLMTLVEDETRYPARQLFYESAPYLSIDNFAQFRWMWYSSWVQVGEMASAFLAVKTRRAILELGTLEKLKTYLTNVGVQMSWDKQAIPRGRFSYFAKAVGNQNRVPPQHEFKLLADSLIAAGDKSVRLDPVHGGVIEMEGKNVAGTAINKLFDTNHGKTIAKWIGKVHTVVKLPLDALNVVLAATALKEKGVGIGSRNVISLVGASADATALALECGLSERAVTKWGIQKATMKMAGGVLGFVSGACDFYDMVLQGAAAHANGTSGQLVGASLGAAGGAMVAIAGGMAFAAGVSPTLIAGTSWAGPVGLVIAAIGTVLLLVGSGIIFLFKANPYEQFAYYCFLGKGFDGFDYNGMMKYFDWGGPMPTKNIRNEAKLLQSLLSNYTVKVVGSKEERRNDYGSAPAWLEIIPGEMAEDTVIEVQVEQVYNLPLLSGGRGERSHICIFHFDALSTQAGVQAPLTLLLDFPAIQHELRADLRLGKIRVPLRPKGLMRGPGEPMDMFDQFGGSATLVKHAVRTRFTSKSFYQDPYLLTFEEPDIVGNDGYSTTSHDNIKKPTP